MSEVKLPVHLDDDKVFLFFRASDAMIFMGCMTAGVLLHALGYAMLVGFGIAYVASKFRGAVQDGYLQHLLYWRGAPIGKGHSLINPYARRFIG